MYVLCFVFIVICLDIGMFDVQLVFVVKWNEKMVVYKMKYSNKVCCN